MSATMAEYIQQDLKGRLQNGGPLDAPLTLPALAKRYQVSLTPVRRAVQHLVDERVLLRQANGRLAVNPQRPRSIRRPRSRPIPAPPADFRNLEAALTGKIIRQSLRRRPEYLREEATARRFGVGRTVLRQIFNRLAGKGLIEHLPRRGWRVHCFDEAEMNAYLEVRVSLELKALQLARPRLQRDVLEAMLSGNRPGPGSRRPRLDNQLHSYLIEKAGNPYIRDFFDRHGLYFTTLFDYAAPEAHVVSAMAGQHRAILRALIAKDWPRARQALARHIRSQRPVLQKLLRRIEGS
jgi:DNA-binding GntR family transcriptional regulator